MLLKVLSQKGEWSQYREKWKKIRITVYAQISQGREKLKDIWCDIFHIQVKLCLSVIAQITLGPDLCTVQTGPNLPTLLTGFICCANTRRRRGTTVLVFCLHFTLTCFPRNLNPTCCPGQLSVLKMFFPSSWTGLWNTNCSPMRQDLWQQHLLKILLLNSVLMTHHAVLSIAPAELLMCPCWEWDQRADPDSESPYELTTSTKLQPLPSAVLWHWVMSLVLQYWISADAVIWLSKGPQKPLGRCHRNSSPH